MSSDATRASDHTVLLSLALLCLILGVLVSCQTSDEAKAKRLPSEIPSSTPAATTAPKNQKQVEPQCGQTQASPSDGSVANGQASAEATYLPGHTPMPDEGQDPCSTVAQTSS